MMNEEVGLRAEVIIFYDQQCARFDFLVWDTIYWVAPT